MQSACNSLLGMLSELSQKQIAVLGGTFDPPHQGHVDAIEQLFEIGHTRVVVAPTAKNPFKSNLPSSLEHRIAMLKLVLAASRITILPTPELLCTEHGVYVSDFPYQRVWQFVEYWRANFANCELHWVVGEDLADEVKSWERWEQLKLKLLVLKERINEHSTEVRQGKLPPHQAIRNYILKHGLFQR